jgi:hypothetical protein
MSHFCIQLTLRVKFFFLDAIKKQIKKKTIRNFNVVIIMIRGRSIVVHELWGSISIRMHLMGWLCRDRQQKMKINEYSEIN